MSEAGGDGGGDAAPAHEAFARYVRKHSEVSRYCVAYSGGMDSHLLLHVAVQSLGTDDAMTLRAVHVDHALHEDSGDWARHAALVAESLGVTLRVLRVRVEEHGEGPEAAARSARYAAFAAELGRGEHLLLAQHASDQAETFLLQALRGSGPDGLASMPEERPFALGVLARPLIACPREALEAEARAAGLTWIEDPSNADTSLDRNYLRHEILPRLERRWPAVGRTFGRTAQRCAAASGTLLALAREDLERARVRGAGVRDRAGLGPLERDPPELSVSELRALPRERAYSVVRLWVRESGLRMPRLEDLRQLVDTLLRSRDGAAGIVDARDYEFRRHRDRLFLLSPQSATIPFHHEWAAPFDDLIVPETALVLTREGCAAQGIALPESGTVTVRSRRGGELIRLGEPSFHKAVKKLLQESGVPPWRRDAIPLLYVGERLAAVWDLAVAVDFRLPAARSAGSASVGDA